ncbi:ATP-binding cassette domain-containing protein [Methanobrevibacter millerae]|uniref:ABC-type multidrug transport system, ATPase and permease component n=1 Tax=Methanobrevibacter millerae TaxID=230361 RepID=A0A1G5W037_9EURY|nr:ABC transporter ATP-binding protein [Methanobrevibacter millerae]SDA51314.1 ABC-type multidrug transport system, ATPase and permease component [Methanobrevibacter millerae]
MRLLIKYLLRKYWKILTLIVIFMFIYTYCQIEIISDLPMLMLLIKEYTIELDSILETGILTVFIAVILLVISSVGVSYLSVRFTSNFGYDIREKLFDIYASMDSMDEFDKIAISGLMTRTVRGIASFQAALMTFIKKVLFVLLLTVTITICLYDIDPRMSLVFALSSLIFLSIFIYKLMGLANSYFKVKAILGKINKRFRDKISVRNLYKQYNKEKLGENGFKSVAYESYHKGYLFQYRLNIFLVILIAMIIVLILVISYFAATFEISSTKIIDIILILLIISYYIRSLSGLISFTNTFHMTYTGATRIEDVLILEKSKNDEIEEISDFKDIRLNDITLVYDERRILSNISLEIEKGSHTLITGDAGSGKSSLMNFLMGFYREFEGEVIVDNNAVSPKSLRRLISYAPDNPNFLKDSVLENIRLGDESISPDDVIEACRVSLFDRDLDFEVYENGKNLNSDLKQRLSISRSIAHEREIYVFDNSFSTINSEDKEIIIRNILDRLDNKTLIFIDNDTESYPQIDKVIELNGGEINGL